MITIALAGLRQVALRTFQMTQQSSKCTRYVFESLLVNWRMSFALFVMRFVQTLRSIALTFSKVEPEACIYGSPYFPISVQSPALASFCPRISMDAPIETQMEGLQRRDRQQSPPDSPPLSDSPRVATEEINLRRREVRIDFLRTSRSSHKFHLEPHLSLLWYVGSSVAIIRS
jgi:hypothetical protein